jgi:catechol-2,3-dioxygenase
MTMEVSAPAGAAANRARVAPVVRVAELGFVSLQSKDPERLADYYVAALGFELVERSVDALYLTVGSSHHCVVIERGSAARARARLGMRVHGSLQDAADRLQNAGIEVERHSDPEPGLAEVLVIAEPGGTPIHLYDEMSPSGLRTTHALRPTRLGHVASFVTDVESIQGFYEQTLGFRWSDTIGDFFVFLRCGPDHHAVNFIQSTRRTGMHHIAFEARDWSHFKELVDHVTACGHPLEWGPGRHGAGHNVFSYHRDPDGNYTEVFTEIDVVCDEETGQFWPRPWHETCPQGPKVWDPDPSAANKWGPFNTEINDH